MNSSLFKLLMSVLLLLQLSACKFGTGDASSSEGQYEVELYIPDPQAKRPYMLRVPFENFAPDIQEGFVKSFERPQEAEDFNKGSKIWSIKPSDDSTRIISNEKMIIKIKRKG